MKTSKPNKLTAKKTRSAKRLRFITKNGVRVARPKLAQSEAEITEVPSPQQYVVKLAYYNGRHVTRIFSTRADMETFINDLR